MSDIMIIDGNNIYDFFISGAKKLIHYEKSLNSINVFPVADGDTGTNLALTMKMVLLKSKRNKNVNDALNSISEVAVENAYGNSGMIFAQFLNGFSIETENKTSITTQEFAEIAQKAAGHAYNAVGSPKEGTILSVMRDWATVLIETINKSEFDNTFKNSVDKARNFVDKTKYKMKVFVENNVVDAGAKAFLIFLEGILEYIKNGKVEESYALADAELTTHQNELINPEVKENRYCSQFYIETESSLKDIKQNLNSMGDSLVVTGKGKHYKVHIHTDYPDKVMDYLTQENTVLSQKIEDMKITSDIIHNRKNKIGIVTDSIADIPRDIIDNEQITVIPINLICDSTLYLDKVTITPESFYKKLNDFEMNPTSAQPSSALFERSFEMLLNHFDSVIGIFISKKMSGTYSGAARVAKRLAKQGKKITIVDSKLNSNAEGLLVHEAARLISEGLEHDEVVEKLNKLTEKIKIFVSVQDLTAMIKGGRISKTAGVVLNKLKLQPVVSIDKNGKGIVLFKTFSQKAAVKKILEQIKRDKQEFGIEKYSLVYSDAIEDITDFKKKLIKLIGIEPAYITQISPVIGLNAGKGAYAVSYVMGGE